MLVQTLWFGSFKTHLHVNYYTISNEDGNVGYLLGFLTLISITHSIVSRSEHTIKVSKAEMIFVTGVFVTAEWINNVLWL